jgi:hypothetical protein
MYNIPAEEVTKSQRQYAKACQLGLGFGAGPATFVRVAKMMGGIDLSLEESKEVVSKWRQAYCEIVEGWRTCNNALPAIAQGATVDVDPWGLVTTDREGFVLPSGRKIRYPNLRLEDNDGKKQWVFGDGRNKGKAYGGLCDENIVQALARDVLMDNAVAIKKETGLWPCHSVHDELIYVVPDLDAEAMLATVQRYMRTPPTWFPVLRTWSEGDIADSYGSAK